MASSFRRTPTSATLEHLRPEHSHAFSPREEGEIMQDIYARGDRLMVWFLASHLLLALGFALFHGTWFATSLIGGGAFLAFLLSAHFAPRTFFTRCLAGVAQQAFVALHIYQLYGQSEQHFWYFTAFTMMIVYQDWLCMWPGALLIIAQHIVFAGMHNAGMPVHFFPEPYVGFSKLFFHFGIALVHVSLCGYWAHLLRMQTLGDAWRRLLMRRDHDVLEEQVVQLRESQFALEASSDALAESDRRQRAILDNSADAMWVKDLQGRYIAVNSACARMAGIPVHAMEGLTATEVLGDEAAQMVAEQEAEVGRTGVALTIERELILDGEPRSLECTITPILGQDGAVTGTTGVARDVTVRRRLEDERRQTESQMRHTQKLESLGLLAGGIAHDFNNLLVGILGNAELARLELPADSPAISSVSQIEQSALRAADLTRQMLAYAGKGKFDVQSVSLSAIVQDMANLLGTVISKKATLRLELDRDLPLVEADATQLRQVVMNLITNASDAIGDTGGVITLRTTSVRVHGHELELCSGQAPLPDGDYVVVDVTDTGVGMSADTQARIFDPFFTTKFVGRGLGLAAVLGIMRSHRGAIDIRSDAGKGSSFRVFLPALDRRTLPPAATALSADAGHLETGDQALILLVDDEPAVRSFAKRALERSGFAVITAGDGIEAVEVFSAHASDISIVVLDMLMPRMNGQGAMRAIRQLAPRVPVILTSGYSGEVSANRLTGEELVEFIQKPYGTSSFITLVRALLARAAAVEDREHVVCA